MSRRADAVDWLRARWYLRQAHLGRRVRLRGRPHVVVGGELRIGDRTQLVSDVSRLSLTVEAGALLEIGDRCYLNHGVSIGATRHVRLGSQVLLGPDVHIIDNDFHRLEPHRRLERPEGRPVVVGDNVWLGTRVLVLPGVTIGPDTVVAAGSVVTRDLPPGVLAAGNPARPVRELPGSARGETRSEPEGPEPPLSADGGPW